MPSSLKWYANNVKPTIRKLTAQGETRLALDFRSQARRNITENDQIGTKHMWNGIGVATPNKITPIPPDGDYLSLKTGRMEHRESGPIPQPTDGALVFAAASHSIYAELRRSFLWRAVEQVQGRRAEEVFVGVGLYAPEGFEASEE